MPERNTIFTFFWSKLEIIVLIGSTEEVYPTWAKHSCFIKSSTLYTIIFRNSINALAVFVTEGLQQQVIFNIELAFTV